MASGKLAMFGYFKPRGEAQTEPPMLAFASMKFWMFLGHRQPCVLARDVMAAILLQMMILESEDAVSVATM